MTMVVVKMLKRKDAASVVVAIAVGLIIYYFVSAISNPWATSLSSRNPAPASDWRTQYLYPLLLAFFELVALEILTWIYLLGLKLFEQK